MDELQQAIEGVIESPQINRLKKISSAITSRYRSNKTLSSEEEMLAYLIVRLPATFAALCEVLSKIEPGTILDIGAGPATSFFASKHAWGQEVAITAIEAKSTFIELGKKLGAKAHWIQSDILSYSNAAMHDWVLFSYSLGEINQSPQLLENCWQWAKKGMIIVEPGTPRGFSHILFARKLLTTLGCGFVVAPCPHALSCPLKSNDWCHFSVRLNRSSIHRQAKQAELPYEDEKFSYLIVSKEPKALSSRIIRRPVFHSGHVNLSLCTQKGLQEVTISRSQKELYKKARKSLWGDSFL